MKAELGFKKKVNELLRREPSIPHIMATLSSSISTMQERILKRIVSRKAMMRGLKFS